MYDDDKDKRRPTVGDGSGSLSFTLDLPIQSRPSLPPSQRYSGNSAQELPRSPTVSLGRTGTHARESSRGVPLQDISIANGVDSERLRTPSSDAQGQAMSGDVSPSASPRDHETREQAEGRSFEHTPALSEVPDPQPSVAPSSPAQRTSDRTQLSYSFLDITTSSRASSVRHPRPITSSSSSTFDSMRRRGDDPFQLTRRISLPFAFGYLHDSPAGSRDITDLSGTSFVNVEFPRFSSNIRPLPRIPPAAVVPETVPSQLPLTARGTVRPHTQSIPPLHVQTEFGEPQRLPRSVSVTPAPPSSIQSGDNPVPHIVIHPSSIMRPRPRASSVVSPTESVPVTVSDIHFRHSSDDEPGEPESRPTSALVIEPPPPDDDEPHPALPERSYTSPFIMHKLFGIPVSPQSTSAEDPLQSPGAGPSKPRDRDPSPDSPSGGSGKPSS
jgi:hypothetical protein